MDTTSLTDLVTRLGRFEQTLQFTAHWAAGVDAARGMPAFDPVDVPKLLSFIYILERDGDRLRFRISGEDVNRLFECQYTGRYLDELAPAAPYRVVLPYFQSVFEGQAVLFRGTITLQKREFMEFERVLVPVTRQGRCMLLGIACFSTTATLRADPPAHPGPGFHFHKVDLETGAVDTAWVDMMPDLNRASAS